MNPTLVTMTNNPLSWNRWLELFSDWKLFANGFLLTIGISIGAFILALSLGILFGAGSASKNKYLRRIARVYVEFFQNTPLLIQVFFVFYGLPLIGITLSVTAIGIVCVGLYQGAYISEVIRSGIQSVPKGQSEAAKSQGFSYAESMRYIILPQAFRVVLPPLTNQIVNLIKNTSTVAIISGVDIMFVANSWSSVNLNYAPAFITAGILYFILCFPLAKLSRRLEEKNKHSYSN